MWKTRRKPAHPVASTQRLFLALWPDDKTRDHIDGLSRKLADWGGRRVPARNLHITLAFLGDVCDSQTAALCQSLDELPSQSGSQESACTITLDHIGYWRQPRVLWLGCATNPAASQLQAGIRRVVRSHELERDPRPWAPHVTVRRNVRRGPQHESIEPLAWTVSEFVLVKSEFSANGGVRYSVVNSWSL